AARSSRQNVTAHPRSTPTHSPTCQGAALVDLSTAIQDLFGDIQSVAQIIAPIAAVIGFVGLGIMYMGSSWPLIGDWKGRP
ncbi:MAG: hypothetical protein SF123_05680, partial [Chloroflexota bacterium]|nr:hypothetical protein [Chloroflexota bacterium]